MPNPKIPLEPDCSYHVFNHAVGNDEFFSCTDNYFYFLLKVKQWIQPVADFYAYCLMPNHFHFVLRIKNPRYLKEHFSVKIASRISDLEKKNLALPPINKMLEELVTEQFSHCFNGYAQAYNKMYHRMGSLFKASFQRKEISTTAYLQRVICYVHNNPIRHGYKDRVNDWKFQSFSEIIYQPSLVSLKQEVLDLFGGPVEFEQVHNAHLGDEILLDKNQLNYLTED